jgi:hypothetical protein
MPSQLFRFILNKIAAKVKNIPVAASFGEIGFMELKQSFRR